MMGEGELNIIRIINTWNEAASPAEAAKILRFTSAGALSSFISRVRKKTAGTGVFIKSFRVNQVFDTLDWNAVVRGLKQTTKKKD